MTDKEEQMNKLRNIIKNYNEEKQKNISAYQNSRLEKQKENMQNMIIPMNNNFYDSIVDNINYTECINGKCSTIDMQNNYKNMDNIYNNNLLYTMDKYKTSNILKKNIDNLVYIIYLIVLIICFFQILLLKKQIYLVVILITTLIYIYYKMIIR